MRASVASYAAALLVTTVCLVLPAAHARADQRRDFMLSELTEGDRLIVDYLGTGAQVSLVRRRSFYSRANDYSLRVSSLLAYSLGQVAATASLRVLCFELEGTLGYRTVWRNLSFEPGEKSYCKDCDRPARRARDPLFGDSNGTDHFPFAQSTLTLYAPLNDYFVMTSFVSLRYEGLRDRSYDWFFANIHDPGLMVNWEFAAFFKHRDWGGIGPYLQLMSLPRAGHHESEFAFGFNAMSRFGLVRRNDLLFFTFLIRPGDGTYGVHSYFAPIRALIVYRLTLPL
jgi:hypothetical protein